MNEKLELSEQELFDEWDTICAKANKALHSDCPLVEDQVLVEMHKRFHQLNAENVKLLTVLSSISNMCIGEIAMNYPLDANTIGQDIFEATGLTSPELAELVKNLTFMTGESHESNQ